MFVRVLTEDELLEDFSKFAEGVYERYVMVSSDDLVNEIMSSAGVYYDIKEINGKYYVYHGEGVIEDFIADLNRKHNITKILTTKISMELIEALQTYQKLDEFMNQPKDDLILYHHTFGRHIRNEYLYPNEDYKDMDLDDVSFEMIEGLHLICNELKNRHTLWFNLYKESVKILNWEEEKL